MHPLFGVAHHRLGLLLGAGHDPRRLLSGLLDRQIGRPLRQDQSPAKGVVVAPGLGRRLFGPLGSLDCLAQAVLEDLNASRYPLKELVDVFGVIAAHLLAEFHFP
jgi:hypothetical protein